jgi:hypothetical protein
MSSTTSPPVAPTRRAVIRFVASMLRSATTCLAWALEAKGGIDGAERSSLLRAALAVQSASELLEPFGPSFAPPALDESNNWRAELLTQIRRLREREEENPALKIPFFFEALEELLHRSEAADQANASARLEDEIRTIVERTL